MLDLLTPTVLIAIATVLVVAVLLSDTGGIWRRRTVFLWLNRLQWGLSAPFLLPLRSNRINWWHTAFLVTLPLTFLYGVVIYIFLAPLRLINAFYFDIFLFWSVTLRNAIDDLIRPELPRRPRWKYVWLWTKRFPLRLLHFVSRSLFGLLQGIAMLLFDVLWPTLTLFHGTSEAAARDIAHNGTWMAGSGDYVGTGLYFGLEERVARHYARSNSVPTIIVARVTLTPCRAIATMPEEQRRLVGRNGSKLSETVKFPWVSVQHWRDDMTWFEFCLILQKRKEKVRPWRIRPICIIANNQPHRLPGGPTRWPHDRHSAGVLAATLLAAMLAVSVLSFYQPTPPPLAAQVSTDCVVRSQIAVSESARVAVDGANLRQTATLLADNVLAVVPAEALVLLLDGPVCVDGGYWWRVEAGAGQIGWMLEIDSAETRLLPPQKP